MTASVFRRIVTPLRVVAAQPLHVMPGLVPGIHAFLGSKQSVDGRDKPGHDVERLCLMAVCRAKINQADNLTTALS